MGKPPNDSSNKVNPIDVILIGDRSNSHTPPFLLTYEFFNKNFHNCLIDSGASSNIKLRKIYSKLNVSPKNSIVHIVKNDRTKVEVLGEMNSVTIGLSSNRKVYQVIDILVADIPKFYGLILSRDWFEKLHGYFSINCSHIWLPYNGKPNLIRMDQENNFKHTVTEFECENEPVAFNNNIIGNYSIESFLGNFNAQKSPF